MTAKQSALRYAYEQCTPATEQWMRLLSSVGTMKGPMGRALIDPSVARLVNSLDQDDDLQASNLFVLNNSMSSSSRSMLGDDSESTCSSGAGLTPWKPDHKFYSPGLTGLNEEIEDFVEYMRPRQDEKMMRNEVVKRISYLVVELWPSAKVEVFGSTATGLFLPTSDIDLVVCWDLDSQPDVMQNALMALEKQIVNKAMYDDVKVLKTSVPIVKFTDRETAIKVDIGFKTTISTGPQSVQFIKEKLIEFPQLECLVLVLKQFLIYHNLLESFNGGISSYCLILLIISYLQMHSSSSENGGESNHSNQGRDLIQFLELYGCQFNYLRTGIRVTDGGSYFRKNDGLTGGHHDNSYQQYSLLCIEDPLKADNDVGRGCYGAMKVRDAFANAFRELRDAVLPQYEHIQPHGSSFLGRILRVPPHIVKYRQFIHRHLLSTTLSSNVGIDDCQCPPAVSTDDRSDSASCSSQISNLSSQTKSSTCQSTAGSVSSGSGAVSDAESDGNSDTVKPVLTDSHQCTGPVGIVPGQTASFASATVPSVTHPCSLALVPIVTVPTSCTVGCILPVAVVTSSSHCTVPTAVVTSHTSSSSNLTAGLVSGQTTSSATCVSAGIVSYAASVSVSSVKSTTPVAFITSSTSCAVPAAVVSSPTVHSAMTSVPPVAGPVHIATDRQQPPTEPSRIVLERQLSTTQTTRAVTERQLSEPVRVVTDRQLPTTEPNRIVAEHQLTTEPTRVVPEHQVTTTAIVHNVVSCPAVNTHNKNLPPQRHSQTTSPGVAMTTPAASRNANYTERRSRSSHVHNNQNAGRQLSSSSSRQVVGGGVASSSQQRTADSIR